MIPLMGVAAGVGLSFLTVAIDRHYPSGLLPGSPISSAADAQYILTTIAGAVVPLTTTVLTVTLVAVQLAMGQFSPRIVRALLDDRSDPSVVAADHSGNVIYVDEQALVTTAHRADCGLVLVPMMGDFVVAGAPLFRIHGDPSRLDRKRARSLVRLG